MTTLTSNYQGARIVITQRAKYANADFGFKTILSLIKQKRAYISCIQNTNYLHIKYILMK